MPILTTCHIRNTCQQTISMLKPWIKTQLTLKASGLTDKKEATQYVTGCLGWQASPNIKFTPQPLRYFSQVHVSFHNPALFFTGKAFKYVKLSCQGQIWVQRQVICYKRINTSRKLLSGKLSNGFLLVYFIVAVNKAGGMQPTFMWD